MESLNVRYKLQISLILIHTFFLLSCRTEKYGVYVGVEEAKREQIKLILNSDKTFKMDLFSDGNFKSKPQKTLVGDWEKNESQLKLITSKDTIVYEQTSETFTIAGKSFTTETYKFKTCKKEFFASNYDLTQDKNEESNN